MAHSDDGSSEPFDAFVRRIAPEHAHLILARVDAAEREYAELRGWLMQTVGSASSLRSAKRVVERLVEDALQHNREGRES